MPVSPLTPPRSPRETARLLQEASLVSYGSDAAHDVRDWLVDSPPRRSNITNSGVPPSPPPLANEEPVEMVRTESASVHILAEQTDLNAETEDHHPDDDDDEDATDAVSRLTLRLRCLFSTITWPIVPLGSIVSLALLWVMYASFLLDLGKSCSHPLHGYAAASLLFVAYAPQHAKIRQHIFQYARDRDGPVRPPGVRMYDQLFHTLCIIYVYGGVTLIQTCRQDVVGGSSNTNNNINMEEQDPVGLVVEKVDSLEDFTRTPPGMSTCEATCPHLYPALSVYVTTLELFAFCLILPLLFLPCIYLWILRRATAEAQALTQLSDRFDNDEDYVPGGSITAQELMDSLQVVQLVQSESQIYLRPLQSNGSSADSLGTKDASHVKECCICMSEFVVSQEDVEAGLLGVSSSSDMQKPISVSETETPPSVPDEESETAVVRTKCGHIFHQQCLAGWIGGRWDANPTTESSSPNRNREEQRRRRARRTCCPLCREDLKPSQPPPPPLVEDSSSFSGRTLRTGTQIHSE